MTKIMTSIIAFEVLKQGEISLDEKFVISEKAWRMSTSGYSSMFVMLNDEVTVEDLLRGFIVVSGNDACVALAEGISGSEEEFVLFMIPFGAYLDVTAAARCCTSSWRRIDDTMIPPRIKNTGLYINSNLA